MDSKKKTMAVVPKKIKGEHAATKTYTLKKGQPVLIESLKRIGIVDTVGENHAEVIVGSFKVKKPLADIVALSAPTRGEQEPSREEHSYTVDDFSADALEHGILRADFHGLYVDEALTKLDKLLDDALLQGDTKLIVVHGHGSGQLKNAIREYCEESAYVKSYRPGELHEGGDGLTIIDVDLG